MTRRPEKITDFSFPIRLGDMFTSQTPSSYASQLLQARAQPVVEGKHAAPAAFGTELVLVRHWKQG